MGDAEVDVAAATSYGFAWEYPGGLPELATRDGSGLPRVQLRERARDACEPIEQASRRTADDALLVLGGPYTAELTRDPATVVVVSDRAAAEQLVHPILSRPASLLARWHGDEAFHAGAFCLGGQAWGVLGARNAGKSTLMAMLHRRGLPILTDDLLVVRRGDALQGPRVADLRVEAAERLGLMGMGLTTRAGARHRVELGSSPPALPLAGWLVLGWGEERLQRLPVDQALGRIAYERLWRRLEPKESQVLDLASLPVFDFVRPADWARSDQSVSFLLDALGR